MGTIEMVPKSDKTGLRGNQYMGTVNVHLLVKNMYPLLMQKPCLMLLDH